MALNGVDGFSLSSMRFPDSFTDEERVTMLQCSLEEAIGESLFSAKLRITDRKRRHLPQKYSHFRKMLYRVSGSLQILLLDV